MTVTDVVLSNLSAAGMQAYLANVFPRMERGDVDLLATVVFHQTGGNFFFIKQLSSRTTPSGFGFGP
jgi:predicted ATPase